MFENMFSQYTSVFFEQKYIFNTFKKYIKILCGWFQVKLKLYLNLSNFQNKSYGLDLTLIDSNIIHRENTLNSGSELNTGNRPSVQ